MQSPVRAIWSWRLNCLRNCANNIGTAESESGAHARAPDSAVPLWSIMDPQLLQQLTTLELDRHTGELDAVIESHSQWLAKVNRHLLFGAPGLSNELDEFPHRICQFSRWYHAIANDELLKMPQFLAIADVHRRLHATAGGLIRAVQEGGRPDPDTYDEMVRHSQQLRSLIDSVRTALKKNFNLVAKLMGRVFEGATEGVIITDTDGTILNVNEAFTNVTGYAPVEAIGQTPRLLNSGKQEEEFYEQMYRSLENKGQWEGEIWNRRKNGDIYLEWLSISAVGNDDGEISHYIGIFSDITEKKQNEERLYRLAHFDPLTSLPNRVLFMDRFRQALARARRNGSQVGTLFLDLDGFKEVNDSLGHGVGDDLLVQVAERLKKTLRESDTVARFGGDEFTIIVPDMENTEGIAAVARKVIGAFERPIEIAGHHTQTTTSIGIAIYPHHGLDADNLVTRADIAMYEAKKAGKNRFCIYDPALDQ